MKEGMLSALRDSTFRSLRHRNYRRYFYGQIVSFTGSWMQSAALMWLMYDRTADPRWPSWLLVAQVGPTILLGAWGGSLADRVPKRRLVMLTQAAFLVNAVLLTVLVATGLAAGWVVLALMGMNGVIQAVDLPARLAFVPDLVPRDDLINAVGLNSLLFNSARAVGPAVAGVWFLLAAELAPQFPGTNPVTAGAVACFAVNAVSFAAVIAALRGIRVAGVGDTHRKPSGSIWDGFRYLFDHPRLGGLVALTLVVCIFGWPLLTLLPAFTRLQLGQAEQAYSLLLSAVGAGALVGAFTVATFGTVPRRKAFLAAGATVTALGILGVSFTTTLGPALGCCVGAGFGMILYLATGQSALQLAVPDEKRGRVMALWAMTLSASAPLGHLIAGEAAATWGVVPVLQGMAAGVGLAAVALMASVVASRRASRRERDVARPDTSA